MPSPRLSPKIARFLGLQMLGTAALIFLGLLFALYHTRPNRMGTTGGIDAINTAITWTALVVIGSALIYLQVNFARQLFAESKGERRGVRTW